MLDGRILLLLLIPHRSFAWSVLTTQRNPCLPACLPTQPQPQPNQRCVGSKDDDEGATGGGGGGAAAEGSNNHGGGNKKEEKYHNCKAGPGCGNRRFRNKEYVKHQIFKEGGCGWGLRALEEVKKGQLVFEYMGEVIDDDILNVRTNFVCCALLLLLLLVGTYHYHLMATHGTPARPHAAAAGGAREGLPQRPQHVHHGARERLLPRRPGQGPSVHA